ncbi:MAG TPA: ABC-2 family transporter protein [Anaerolineae bacterium]|nr:ABC-2 family transporter protein [Anaerolineae bacterium]
MYHLRLVSHFARASAQNELAYRANFWISLLHSLLNLGTGVLGVMVLFGQVETIRGWDLPSTLALLGVYLTLSAVRGLVIGPSLEGLAGMDGEIWTGQFDYTLLRPVNAQFLASVRHWRPFALIDLVLGLGVLVAAAIHLGQSITLTHLATFLLTMGVGMAILYAILLTFAAMTLWNPGFLFTWVFDGLFQMARYPVGIYPRWLRLVLTWVVPVGIMTTMPAQALTGHLSVWMLIGGMILAGGLLAGASLLFRFGLRRYASASS